MQYKSQDYIYTLYINILGPTIPYMLYIVQRRPVRILHDKYLDHG